ncbi:MAG: NAD-dependent epimerase/dehydratase family protein [Alphaproteobacteria bacterium]
MTVHSGSGEPLGVVEWFRVGDRDRVDQSIERMQRIGIRRLRTHLSWADFHTENGDWYDWLIPHVAAKADVLPCIHYTPPSLSRTGRTSGPPRRPLDYADFIDLVLDRYGQYFEWIELWNEPNNLNDWDWRADPDWNIYCQMIGAAAHWAQQRGWKTLLGGPCPTDLNWLKTIGERGVLAKCDAIGLHGFPGTWESAETLWQPWREQVTAVRALLQDLDIQAEIWLTEVGYSSWRNDPAPYAHCFLDAMEAPVTRVYWYMLEDIHPAVPTQDGLRFDPRHYHFGLYDADGVPKLTARLLEKDGLEAVKDVKRLMSAPAIVGKTRPVVITGGAGFIGSNLADSLAADGQDVLVFDALSRPGVEENLEWLRRRHPRKVAAAIADVRDKTAVDAAVGSASAVYHFAAQVAVTTSLSLPESDFDINAKGTLNVLEAVRNRPAPPPVIFASTNKVYGDLSRHEFILVDGRWGPVDTATRTHGVSEAQPLDFCTPYGCSKGAADQYVLDYAQTFDIPATVLRMSCIYGPRQFGTEDQGWIAHFLIRARADEALTIFGDGRQVRDVLHVADAVTAYRKALTNIDTLRGQPFNLGGGAANAVSLLQVLDEMESLLGRPVRIAFSAERTGDQLYYVSDTSAFIAATGWKAQVRWRDGLRNLDAWLNETALPTAGRHKARVA